MSEVKTRNVFRVTVTAEHREGICRQCNVVLVKEFYMDGERERAHMMCPVCGAMGRLIAKTFSVQPPNPPQCLSVRCLYRFFMDTFFCALLSNYHSRRVAYAERNRNKEILERYRTGQPSPKNIWQAIHANIKLKCPVCRKYNIDPLLFRRRV